MKWAIANSHFLDFHNRVPPDWDIRSGTLLFSAIFVYSLFLLIVITARRRKISTLIVGSVVIITGFVILFAFEDRHWYYGETNLLSSYSFLEPTKFVRGELRMMIGLWHFNVSYFSLEDKSNFSFSYNEAFDFHAHRPGDQLDQINVQGLEKGLPNPILSILDQMSFTPHKDGVLWSNAGNSTGESLIFVSCCYIVGFVLLVITPRYGLYFLFINGSSLLGSAILYGLKAPFSPIFSVEGTSLSFGFGRMFFITFACGLLNLVTGAGIFLSLKFKWLKKVSTFFELNFDTPWDNRVIVQASAEAKENQEIRFSYKHIRRSFRRFHDSFNHKISLKFQSNMKAFNDCEEKITEL